MQTGSAILAEVTRRLRLDSAVKDVNALCFVEWSAQLPRLPGTRTEAEQIGDWQSVRRTGDLLLDLNANEDDLKNRDAKLSRSARRNSRRTRCNATAV